ncbi:NAD(P)-binding protein [Aspergillus pseudoustus]|uniref:NAD(P)-binding protein n=1 Tax=Aspergillus pseudoustus TaxID=1810923 RepID=A0ABR4JH75_9EURO
MTSNNPPKIFIIGGTGAQGIPVIAGLVADKKYAVRVLTRDVSSPRAQHLLSLGNVELVAGTFASESDLRTGFRGCQGAFVNIDGFNCGEKTEVYWAIRAYELAREEGGVKFFVYGNLDYGYKLSGFKKQFRCGHYDGKGRVGEWILFQNQQSPDGGMKAAIFTTGPYIEMAIGSRTPMSPTLERDEKSGDDVLTWRVPLGAAGAVPHVALEDCGHYVRWLFDNPTRASGLDLAVAIEHVDYAELARAFSAVTGKRARFVDVDMETYWTSGPLSRAANWGAAYNSDPSDPAFMTIRDNFTGFWNLWRASGGNTGVVKRDYKLLDEIHPKRIRSAEEWFRKVDERGIREGKGSLWEQVQPKNMKPPTKNMEDGRKGRL